MCFGMEAKRCICYILSLALMCGTMSADSDSIDKCPPSQLIEPCVCGMDPDCWAEVTCSGITVQEEGLSRGFTSEYQFGTFRLKHSSVMFIPDSLLEVRRLRFLLVSDSSFESLFNSTPTAGNSITWISLKKVRILRGFQWEVLSGFQQLDTLGFYETPVPMIDQSFIDYAPKSLVEVEIEGGSTLRIHDKAFASLPELRRVSLSGQIREVKRSMFPTPAKLVMFVFRNNLLSSLPDDIFNEMPYLQYIVLYNNLLKEIPGNIFGPVFPKLTLFMFNHNPLKCGCNVRWITVVKNKLLPTDFLGMCQEPINLKGRQIRDLVQANFSHCDSV